MPKRSYNQFCPASRALDLIGERWTLLIVRNLLRGPRRYTDLRDGLPGMASNLLAHRLSEMEAAGLVHREEIADPNARALYSLTERGEELRPVVVAVGRFGLPYLDMPTDDQPMIDEMLPEAIATMVLIEELPDSGIEIDLDLDEGFVRLIVVPQAGPGRRTPALARVQVSPDRPATNAPTRITGSVAALLWVRRGELSGAEALDSGALAVEGGRGDIAVLKRLFGFSRRSRQG